ncbi:asparagine synthase (glutamine-hydrolyzing) [Streptomyces morookaense]|uniref:asparagine synthase (glutamine-hydrolyzing) n=1 Tax=Streptomyces morookaense TaxID=1970 RepID=A0A7Y7B114_STRMO|nr:asparagine synthase (glutamine-hydrolyzing) [Streptomyces morookaense]NVK77075.1 asparagine synthase (glutamine-hydrolyzing) [Streptomyces morookaense]GHF23805.1 asparagine synthetase B [Streptomyces morookaense]
MCGITGWVDFTRDLAHEAPAVEAMTRTLIARGPDAGGTWLDTHAALGHRRLAIIDLEHGTQPMRTPEPGPRDGLPRAVISYGGEIYNFRELREELVLLGHRFTTRSDTEVALRAYLEWGAEFVHRLNGMYAIALWDTAREELLLIRDRLGVKPLFYHPTPGGVLFGSEPKAILANPLAQAAAGAEELCDALLFLRTPGRVPFRGMHEVKPGHLVRVGRDGIREERYWALESRPHTDDLRTTIATVRDLLDDIVPRQMVADVPLVSLLSGGLDSSTVTALAARTRAASGSQLSTFSVDFTGHTENFQADAIRPTPDGPYALEVARHVGSDHHAIVLDRARLLDPAVRQAVLGAWDLPFNFADLDVSLYLLFAAVREHATVALSGEGADEVFGGYLWFSDPGARSAETFPWLKLGAHRGLDPRNLFHPWFVDGIDLAEYQADLYRTALAEVPHLEGEDAEARRTRELGYITLTRWLPILLDKKDRMGMAGSLEGRVPFCDHRLVEYVFNVPWEMKTFSGEEKALLRAAAADLLPESVLRRKKAAYPSIQDPAYDRALITGLATAAGEGGAPLSPFLDGDAVRRLTARTSTGSLSEFERILVESTVRLDDWLRTYEIELTDVKGSAC